MPCHTSHKVSSLHNTEVDHQFLTSEGEIVFLLLKGDSLCIENILTSGLVFALFCSPPNSSSSYKQSRRVMNFSLQRRASSEGKCN